MLANTPGSNAAVLVVFALIGGTPTNSSAGNVRKLPPPATEFNAPPNTAAANRTIHAIIAPPLADAAAIPFRDGGEMRILKDHGENPILTNLDAIVNIDVCQCSDVAPRRKSSTPTSAIMPCSSR